MQNSPTDTDAKDVTPAPPEARSSWGSFLLETLQTIILAVVLYFLIDTVIARVRVENLSMQPTLQPGEFLLVNKFAYRFGTAKHGDIIVFHFPQNPKEDYIKRVIGLPGDTVVIQNGVVSVNGTALTEPYISAPPTYSGEWQVPENAYFVLGDNRNQSSDSHSWGFVPSANIVGKALLVYWPLGDLKILSSADIVLAAN